MVKISLPNKQKLKPLNSSNLKPIERVKASDYKTLGYCQICRKEGYPARRPINPNFGKGIDIRYYCPRCDRQLTSKLSQRVIELHDLSPENLPLHEPKFTRDQIYPTSKCCKVDEVPAYVMTTQETMGDRYLGKMIWVCSKCLGFQRLIPSVISAHRCLSRSSIIGIELCSRVKNGELGYYARPFEKPHYHTYLQSYEWKRKRIEAMKRADYKCQLCSSRDELRVHHNTYERLGHENLSDLFVLCDSCHSKFHDKIKGPPSKAEEQFQRFVKTLG